MVSRHLDPFTASTGRMKSVVCPFNLNQFHTIVIAPVKGPEEEVRCTRVCFPTSAQKFTTRKLLTVCTVYVGAYSWGAQSIVEIEGIDRTSAKGEKIPKRCIQLPQRINAFRWSTSDRARRAHFDRFGMEFRNGGCEPNSADRRIDRDIEVACIGYD